MKELPPLEKPLWARFNDVPVDGCTNIRVMFKKYDSGNTEAQIIVSSDLFIEGGPVGTFSFCSAEGAKVVARDARIAGPRKNEHTLILAPLPLEGLPWPETSAEVT